MTEEQLLTKALAYWLVHDDIPDEEYHAAYLLLEQMRGEPGGTVYIKPGFERDKT